MFRKFYHLFIRSEDPLMRHFSGQGSRRLLRRPIVMCSLAVGSYLLMYLILNAYLAASWDDAGDEGVARVLFHVMGLTLIGHYMLCICSAKPPFYLERMGGAFLLQDLKLTQLTDRQVFSYLYFGCYRQTTAYLWLMMILALLLLGFDFARLFLSSNLYSLRALLEPDTFYSFYWGWSPHTYSIRNYSLAILQILIIGPLLYTVPYQALAWRYALKWKHPMAGYFVVKVLIFATGPAILLYAWFSIMQRNLRWLYNVLEYKTELFTCGWLAILILEFGMSKSWGRFIHNVKFSSMYLGPRPRLLRDVGLGVYHSFLKVFPIFVVMTYHIPSQFWDWPLFAIMGVGGLAWGYFGVRLFMRSLRDFRKLIAYSWLRSIRISVILAYTVIYSVMFIYERTAGEIEIVTQSGMLLLIATTPLIGLKLFLLGRMTDRLPRNWARLAGDKLDISG